MRNPWIIIGVITVALFGGAIWYSSVANERNNEGVVIQENVKGNPDAEHVLVKYSDLQCPACAAFAPVVDDVLESYGDRIRFEYKHFPLPIHRFAIQAAVAAEAAGMQGKFFEFHDLLFDNQQQWGQSSSPQIFFIQYAEQLELDIDTFRRHMNSSVLRNKVQDELSEGRQLGINSTPTFFLNGEVMNPEEFQTFQGFVEAIALTVDPEASAALEAAAAEAGIELQTETESSSGVRFGL